MKIVIAIGNLTFLFDILISYNRLSKKDNIWLVFKSLMSILIYIVYNEAKSEGNN
jgi:hypothetical protein